jgi:hypothetical protein
MTVAGSEERDFARAVFFEGFAALRGEVFVIFVIFVVFVIFAVFRCFGPVMVRCLRGSIVACGQSRAVVAGSVDSTGAGGGSDSSARLNSRKNRSL